MRTVRKGHLVAAALAGVLAACGGDRGTGTVVVGVRSDFGGFNPVTNVDLYTGELMKYGLFTPLIQYDEDLRPAPYLARSWQIEGDTAVVFHLRRDIHWQDGPLVTAADVKFTFDLAKDPATASLLGSAFLAEVAEAQVEDSFTIRFGYARPHAQALEDFWWSPLPEHLLRDIPPAELRQAPFNRNPVGSGPYRLSEWRANERVVLVPNPDFPAELGGPPAVDRVVLRIVPEASTMLTELMTGTVHVDLPVFPDQVERIRADSSFKVFAFPGRTVYYVGWNDARPPFDDPRVRRALALAIDRQEIIDALLYGQGTLAESTIPPWHPLYPGDVPPLTRDTAEANRLLSAAGWVDRDGDGIREDRRHRPLRFTMLTSDDALRRAVVEVLQAQLRRAGADVQVQVTEFQTMLAAHKQRDFDAVFTNWVLDNFQVASPPTALLHSRFADVPGSANRSSVRIPELDRLIDEGAAATDPERAREIWRNVTRVLQREQPVTFMFWLNELAASNTRVGGVEMDPRGELLSMPHWFFEAGGRQ